MRKTPPARTEARSGVVVCTSSSCEFVEPVRVAHKAREARRGLLAVIAPTTKIVYEPLLPTPSKCPQCGSAVTTRCCECPHPLVDGEDHYCRYCGREFPWKRRPSDDLPG